MYRVPAGRGSKGLPGPSLQTCGGQDGWLTGWGLHHNFRKFLGLLPLPVQRCSCFVTWAEFTSTAQIETLGASKESEQPECLAYRKKLQGKSLCPKLLASPYHPPVTPQLSVPTADWNNFLEVLTSSKPLPSWVCLTMLFSLKCIFSCWDIASLFRASEDQVCVCPNLWTPSKMSSTLKLDLKNHLVLWKDSINVGWIESRIWGHYVSRKWCISEAYNDSQGLNHVADADVMVLEVIVSNFFDFDVYCTLSSSSLFLLLFILHTYWR